MSERTTGSTAVWAGLALLGVPGGAVCGGIGECELVQTSEYSDIAGVPVALLGLLYFGAMAVLALARIRRIPAALEWGEPAALSMALAGTGFISYLTYVELFVLEAICIWCVALATITVASLGLTVWALLSGGDG